MALLSRQPAEPSGYKGLLLFSLLIIHSILFVAILVNGKDLVAQILQHILSLFSPQSSFVSAAEGNIICRGSMDSLKEIR